MCSRLGSAPSLVNPQGYSGSLAGTSSRQPLRPGTSQGLAAGRRQQQQQRRQPAAPCCGPWGSPWGRHDPPPKDLANDPEAKFRQYGEDFGKGYFLQGVMETAPRVRVRTSRDRARDQIADLAVLNERLAGKGPMQAADVRKRLEYLKKRRRNWELVYQHVTRADALCTLGAIEEAAARVEALLSEESRERHSVSALKRQLVELQGEVSEAHQRLHLTQARVEQNLLRISELKEESSRLDEAVAAAGSSAQAPVLQDAGSSREALAALNAAAAASAGSSSSSSATADHAARTAPAAASAVAAMPPPVASTPAPSGAAGASSGEDEQLTPAQAARRGLRSSLEIEEGLRNHWFAAAFVSKLGKEDTIPFELFGQAWVLFRGADGRPACILDECAHRACPLSIGTVVDGCLQCPYHGWRYNGKGECTKMPSTALCRGVAVSSLPCAEQDGFVWVWPGWEEPPLPLPTFTRPPPGYRIHAEIEVEVPVEHGLLVENLLDLAHAPFTHTSTFARGWPVPDAVKFQASRLLGGNWDPYPIEMSFQPPCMTLSHIGMARPGKAGSGATPADCQNHLHQLHVCLPSRPGHTRLLYRMATDFLWWTELVPGIQAFWKHIAAQVLGEDLVLVQGQQDRLVRGGDTWRHPVSYDKLAVRYRRWRNSLSLDSAAHEGGVGEAGQRVAAPPTSQPISMGSGELFALDEEVVEQAAEQQTGDAYGSPGSS